MLFVLRVEGTRAAPVPWVTVGVAALSLVVLLSSMAVPSPGRSGLEEVVRSWQAEPRLDLPDRVRSLIPGPVRQRIRDSAVGEQPPPDAMYEQQQVFDRQCALVLEDLGRSVYARFGLVPADGPLQVGWLTHPFIHWGWLHLLFNIFFFHPVAPFLERRWGPLPFAAFFVLGAAVAGAAQLALEPTSVWPIVGASGALAACMGAFTFPCAFRSMTVGLAVPPRFPRLAVPAVMWSGLWFAVELVNLTVIGGQSGPATLAHVGAWIFGWVAGAAGVASGLEARWNRPALPRGMPGSNEVGARPAGPKTGGRDTPPWAAIPGAAVAVGAALLVRWIAVGQQVPVRAAGLTVTTTVPGALVRMDGREAGVTPLRWTDLRPGRVYKVEVEKEGYVVDRPVRFVYADEAQGPVRFQLHGRVDLRIESTPEDALVWLDGRRLGRTPLDLPPLRAASRHELELTSPGYMRVRRTLEATEDAQTRFELEPALRVSVDTQPEYAKVRVDGELRGETPIPDLEIPAGRRFVLELSRVGHRPVKLRLDPRRMKEGQRLRYALKALPFAQLPMSDEERAQYRDLSARLARARALARTRSRQLARMRAKVDAHYDRASLGSMGIGARIDLENRLADAEARAAEAEEELSDLEARLENLKDAVRTRLEAP